MKWYAKGGSTHFFCYLANQSRSKVGLKWRKVAEERMNKWPDNNEKFVITR